MIFTAPIYWYADDKKSFITKEIEVEALTCVEAHDKLWTDAEMDKFDKLSGGKCVYIGTVREKIVQGELL